MGDHLKDDDFPNAKLFAFDVEKNVIRGKLPFGLIFSKGTNKQL